MPEKRNALHYITISLHMRAMLSGTRPLRTLQIWLRWCPFSTRKFLSTTFEWNRQQQRSLGLGMANNPEAFESECNENVMFPIFIALSLHYSFSKSVMHYFHYSDFVMHYSNALLVMHYSKGLLFSPRRHPSHRTLAMSRRTEASRV